MTDIDFAALISLVAHRLWGEPNTALSNAKNLRWGTHGSKSVDLNKGVWHDHETNEGGGTLDLVKRETGHADKDALTWLEREGFIDGHAAANGRVVATYNYTDETGALLFQVCRFAPKDFRQRRANGTGWTWNLKDTRRVLYRLPALFEAIANDRPVLIVEGEKDCDNLHKLNITATTNPGGANKWRPEYNEYLRNAAVILVPDNDDPGRAHMQAVAAELNGIAKSIRVLELPDLPDKGDVTDWIKNGGTAEKLWEMIERTPQWNAPPTNDLDEFTFDGTETITPPPMLIEELLPARGIAIVGGQSGAGKTFLVISLGTCLAGGDLIALHVSDLGGDTNISAAEHSLVRRASTLEVELERLEGKFAAAGEACAGDLETYQRCANSLRRLLESVGLERRSRLVSSPPTLEEIAHEMEAEREARE